MIHKTITYTDYNGTERTEDFYFNLSKAELIELETSVPGGISETINRITQTQDVPAITKLFKKIILLAYGEKSADGKRFIKSEELSKEFSQTEAYSELFTDLVLSGDANKAAEFINGLLPAGLADQVAANKK